MFWVSRAANNFPKLTDRRQTQLAAPASRRPILSALSGARPDQPTRAGVWRAANVMFAHTVSGANQLQFHW